MLNLTMTGRKNSDTYRGGGSESVRRRSLATHARCRGRPGAGSDRRAPQWTMTSTLFWWRRWAHGVRASKRRRSEGIRVLPGGRKYASLCSTGPSNIHEVSPADSRSTPFSHRYWQYTCTVSSPTPHRLARDKIRPSALVAARWRAGWISATPSF